MTSDSKGYLISGKTVRGLAENERQRRGYLSPLPKMQRRRYQGVTIEPFIVTEKQTDTTLGGPGENVAIDKNYPFRSDFSGFDSEGYFKARPYIISNASNRLDIRSLGVDPEEDVWVATRMIPTALFTGQLILVGSAGTHVAYVEDKPVVGDVVSGCIGNMWTGIVRQASDRTNKTLVDLEFTFRLRNDTATLPQYCRIWASNMTDAIVVVGQTVRVAMFAYPANGGQGSFIGYGSRWQIVDYNCPPPALLNP